MLQVYNGSIRLWILCVTRRSTKEWMTWLVTLALYLLTFLIFGPYRNLVKLPLGTAMNNCMRWRSTYTRCNLLLILISATLLQSADAKYSKSRAVLIAIL